MLLLLKFLLIPFLTLAGIESNTLRIGFSDWASLITTNTLWDGNFTQSISATVFVAAEHFNARRTDIIPDFSRLLSCAKNVTIAEYCDTGGSPLRNAQNIVHMIWNKNVDVIQGPGSEGELVESTNFLSAVAGQMPMLSHWISSVQFTDKQAYPSFASVTPSERDSALAMATLMAQLGFSEVVLLTLPDTAVFSSLLATILSTQFAIQLDIFSFDYSDLNATIFTAVGKAAQTGLNIYILSTWAAQLPNFAQALEANRLLDDTHSFFIYFAERDPMQAELDAFPALVNLMNNSLRVANTVEDNENFQNLQSAWPSHTTEAINPVLPPRGAKNDTSCANSNFNAQLPPDFFVYSGHWLTVVHAFAYDAVLAYGFALCELAPNASNPVPSGAELLAHLGSSQFQGFNGTSTRGKFTFNPNTLYPDIHHTGFALTNYYFPHTTAKPVLAHRMAGVWTAESTFKLDLAAITWRGPRAPQTDNDLGENRNLLSLGLRGMGYGLFALLLLMEVYCAVFLVRHRTARVVINAQPMLMGFILFGCAVASLALLTLMVDDSGLDLIDPSTGCMLTPVFFSVGFSLALVSLCAKTRRIQTIFQNSKMIRATTSSLFQVVKLVVVVGLVLPLGWIALWWGLAPLVFVRQVTQRNARGKVSSSTSLCTAETDTSLGFLISTLLVFGLLLLFSAVLAQRVREVPTEYHEAKWISFAVASLAQIYLLAIPTVIVVYAQVVGRYVLLSLLVFTSVAMVLGCIFLPKIWLVTFGWVLAHPKWVLTQIQSSRREEDEAPKRPNPKQEIPKEKPSSSKVVMDEHVFLTTRGGQPGPTDLMESQVEVF